MLECLLVALIDDHAGAGIDDLVVLNEQGVLLRFSVRIKLETCEPSGPLEMIDWPHAGNFQVTQLLDVRKNCPDVVADDLAIVRRRQVGGDCGAGSRSRRPILNQLARRATGQGHCQRCQGRTYTELTALTLVRGRSEGPCLR